MPGHATSEAAKHRATLSEKEALDTHAVSVYNGELQAYQEHREKKPSYHGVAECFGIKFLLLQHCVLSIGTSKAQSNANKSHLNDTEGGNPNS